MGRELILKRFDVTPIASRENSLPAFRAKAVLVKTWCSDETSALQLDGALYASGAQFSQYFVAAFPLGAGQFYQGGIIVYGAYRPLGCFFENVVGILPIKAVETHSLSHLSDDPPIRFGLARRGSMILE